MNFSIRFAKEDDVPTILQFITSLAKYEKLEHEVVATEDLLRETLFGDRPQAETLLAFEDETSSAGSSTNWALNVTKLG